MMIGMLFFWIIVIGLAVLLVRGLFQTNGASEVNQQFSARNILEQRYTRGEINQEQYKLMLKDIS